MRRPQSRRAGDERDRLLAVNRPVIGGPAHRTTSAHDAEIGRGARGLTVHRAASAAWLPTTRTGRAARGGAPTSDEGRRTAPISSAAADRVTMGRTRRAGQSRRGAAVAVPHRRTSPGRRVVLSPSCPRRIKLTRLVPPRRSHMITTGVLRRRPPRVGVVTVRTGRGRVSRTLRDRSVAVPGDRVIMGLPAVARGSLPPRRGWRPAPLMHATGWGPSVSRRSAPTRADEHSGMGSAGSTGGRSILSSLDARPRCPRRSCDAPAIPRRRCWGPWT